VRYEAAIRSNRTGSVPTISGWGKGRKQVRGHEGDRLAVRRVADLSASILDQLPELPGVHLQSMSLQDGGASSNARPLSPADVSGGAGLARPIFVAGEQ
jgi:hypothetical protein